MEKLSYRTSYEHPEPTRRRISVYISQAKTPEERKVWRDLLNSEAYIKPKTQKTGSLKKKKKD